MLLTVCLSCDKYLALTTLHRRRSLLRRCGKSTRIPAMLLEEAERTGKVRTAHLRCYYVMFITLFYHVYVEMQDDGVPASAHRSGLADEETEKHLPRLKGARIIPHLSCCSLLYFISLRVLPAVGGHANGPRGEGRERRNAGVLRDHRLPGAADGQQSEDIQEAHPPGDRRGEC